MRVCYIVGPYTLAADVTRAEDLARAVWKLGIAGLAHRFCYLPVTDDASVDADLWRQADLELLRRCDAALTTDDWASSAEAQADVTFAQAHKVPVFHTLHTLAYWLEATT